MANQDPPIRMAKLSDRATTPTRGTPNSAGYDLYSALDTIVPPGERTLIPTDLQMALPPGHYGQIAPRSGLALKHGIDIGGGVIDQDYRGNVGVILINASRTPFQVRQGDRIAQLLCIRISQGPIIMGADLETTTIGLEKRCC